MRNKFKPKLILLFLPLLLALGPGAQYSAAPEGGYIEAKEIGSAAFTRDKVWRGGDGAATVDLGNGRVLWLFGDTFIDTKASGKRSNATMVHNSIAIQTGYKVKKNNIRFYHGGKRGNPKSFFRKSSKTWFWPGQGVMVNEKLIIFLCEVRKAKNKFGFKTLNWHIAIIDNPQDNPKEWFIDYAEGPKTSGIILGFSTVLKVKNYIYVYGDDNTSKHKICLARFAADKLAEGDIKEEDIEWWAGDKWKRKSNTFQTPAFLFEGASEFSIYYDPSIKKYIQIQAFFLKSKLGFRTANHPEGPWSEANLFYTPQNLGKGEFIYSARAHPELKSKGTLITYNINNKNFGKLVKNENIYFPRFVKIRFGRRK